jgi:pimeloyl-ACP methyl ester carboxylesterase
MSEEQFRCGIDDRAQPLGLDGHPATPHTPTTPDTVPECRRGAETGVVRTRGLRLEVLDWGDIEQARTVVLGLHGFLDAAAFLGPLAQRVVGPQVAVRALTFAGHGRSEAADVYRWFDHTSDVLALAADTTRRAPHARVVLLGHSFGAVQALEAARWLRPAPAAVVNLDAVSGPSKGPGGEQRGTEIGAAARRLPVYPMRDDVVDRRASFNPRLSRAQLLDLFDEYAAAVDGGWAFRVDPALTGWVRPWAAGWGEDPDAVRLMELAPMPVLLVTGGAHDHPQIRGGYPGDAVLGALAGVEHHRLAGAGHYVHLECANEVADLIRDFVDRLP